MKRPFAPLLVMAVVVLTSLSECEKEVYAPISAVVNGTLYSNEGDTFLFLEPQSAYIFANFTQEPTTHFSFGLRTLTSKNGDEIRIELSISHDDSLPFKLNTKYSEGIYFFIAGKFDSNQDKTYTNAKGWVEFTEHTEKPQRIIGRFSFIVPDETGKNLLEITDGYFNLPY